MICGLGSHCPLIRLTTTGTMPPALSNVAFDRRQVLNGGTA